MRHKGEQLSAIFIKLNLKIRLGVCVGVYFFVFPNKIWIRQEIKNSKKIEIWNDERHN